MTTLNNQTRKYYDKKIDDIYKNHLIRAHAIGDDHDAEGPTLIDYVLEQIPIMKSKIKKAEDSSGQTAFILRNFQGKVN